MAAIHDLIAQVHNMALRARLEQEINRLSKTKTVVPVTFKELLQGLIVL